MIYKYILLEVAVRQWHPLPTPVSVLASSRPQSTREGLWYQIDALPDCELRTNWILRTWISSKKRQSVSQSISQSVTDHHDYYVNVFKLNWNRHLKTLNYKSSSLKHCSRLSQELCILCLKRNSSFFWGVSVGGSKNSEEGRDQSWLLSFGVGMGLGRGLCPLPKLENF